MKNRDRVPPCTHHSRVILKRNVIQCTECRKILRRVGDGYREITVEEVGKAYWVDNLGRVRLPPERKPSG